MLRVKFECYLIIDHMTGIIRYQNRFLFINLNIHKGIVAISFR